MYTVNASEASMAECDNTWGGPHGEMQKPEKTMGKRRNIRFQVMNTRLKIRKSGVFSFLTGTENRASLVDLSRAGLQALITESLRAEENYKVNLYVPGCMDPLMMKATVVWCNVHKTMVDKTYYRAGFMFTELNQNAARHLQRLEAVA